VLVKEADDVASEDVVLGLSVVRTSFKIVVEEPMSKSSEVDSEKVIEIEEENSSVVVVVISISFGVVFSLKSSSFPILLTIIKLTTPTRIKNALIAM
jgi:hypothetical protein